ncbi:hypothetical protein NL676_003286 [Syzygium grande]|nr:hypothetical protein NL676_003286 [Syzygium grande]
MLVLSRKTPPPRLLPLPSHHPQKTSDTIAQPKMCKRKNQIPVATPCLEQSLGVAETGPPHRAWQHRGRGASGSPGRGERHGLEGVAARPLPEQCGIDAEELQMLGNVLLQDLHAHR